MHLSKEAIFPHGTASFRTIGRDNIDLGPLDDIRSHVAITVVKPPISIRTQTWIVLHEKDGVQTQKPSSEHPKFVSIQAFAKTCCDRLPVEAGHPTHVRRNRPQRSGWALSRSQIPPAVAPIPNRKCDTTLEQVPLTIQFILQLSAFKRYRYA